MNLKLAWVLFAFAFLVAAIVGFGGKEDLRPAPAEFRAKFHETLLKPRVKPGTPAIQPANPRNPSSDQSDRRPAGAAIDSDPALDPLTAEQFARRYGERLVLTRYEGRVIRVDGSGLGAEAFEKDQTVAGFRPSNADEVSARAREVFERARRILGIPDDAEFILLPPTTGESSAQVIAQQSAKGIPITPGGLVTILLGPDGEVRAIDSSIYPQTEIVNTASLAPAGASREILFVTQSAPKAVLHHAYETRERGIQKVIDAQTGEVLLEKDRRMQ